MAETTTRARSASWAALLARDADLEADVGPLVDALGVCSTRDAVRELTDAVVDGLACARTAKRALKQLVADLRQQQQQHGDVQEVHETSEGGAAASPISVESSSAKVEPEVRPGMISAGGVV